MAEVLGKELVWANRKYPVVGAMSDFNLRLLHEPVKPTLVVAKVYPGEAFEYHWFD